MPYLRKFSKPTVYGASSFGDGSILVNLPLIGVFQPNLITSRSSSFTLIRIDGTPIWSLWKSTTPLSGGPLVD